MVGNLFQSWFIVFIGLSLFFNEAQPALLKDLSFTTILFSGIFIFIKRKKFIDLDSYLFFLSGLALILFENYIGMTLLPDSQISRQKLYLRFFFYFTVAFYFYLHHLEKTKKEIIIYTVLASSHIFIFRYHYSSLAIAFFLLVNLFSLKKLTIYKKNSFDLLVLFILFIAMISTYQSFFYNGSNSIFGFFYLFSGVLIYIYIKYFISEEQILDTFKLNLLLYSISILLYFTFITISVLSTQGSSQFRLNIAGFHISNIGSMISVSLPILFNLYFLKKGKIKIYYFAFILISFFVLYFTHSRSATLAIIISFFLSIFYFLFFKKASYKNFILIFIIISVFIAFFIGKKFFQSEVFSSESMSIRFLIWKAYIERVTHHSILFGFGSNNEFFHTFLPTFYLPKEVFSELQSYLINFKANPHAHNLYIQFFYNYGLVGFGTLMSLIVLFFYNLFKRLRTEISDSEILASSVIISVLLQEFFDYTLLDPMTFFPLMIAIATISRNSASLKDFKKSKYFSSLTSRMSLIFAFFLLFFISLLSFNFVISEKIKYLFRGKYTNDNFSNLRFTSDEAFTKSIYDRFKILDALYIPINIDDKKEQFTGTVYLKFFELNQDPKDLESAKKNFLKCIQIFPNSAICYKKLYSIAISRENLVEAEQFKLKYEENDPFHLVKD